MRPRSYETVSACANLPDTAPEWGSVMERCALRRSVERLLTLSELINDRIAWPPFYHLVSDRSMNYCVVGAEFLENIRIHIERNSEEDVVREVLPLGLIDTEVDYSSRNLLSFSCSLQPQVRSYGTTMTANVIGSRHRSHWSLWGCSHSSGSRGPRGPWPPPRPCENRS